MIVFLTNWLGIVIWIALIIGGLTSTILFTIAVATIIEDGELFSKKVAWIYVGVYTISATLVLAAIKTWG